MKEIQLASVILFVQYDLCLIFIGFDIVFL